MHVLRLLSQASLAMHLCFVKKASPSVFSLIASLLVNTVRQLLLKRLIWEEIFAVRSHRILSWSVDEKHAFRRLTESLIILVHKATAKLEILRGHHAIIS